MPGHAVDESSGITGARLSGVPVNLAGPNTRNQFDYGTLTVGNSGKYKAFASPFGNRPIVILSAIRTSGSQVPILIGTPNVGSFHAKVNIGGSTPLQYFAIGAR